MFKRLLQKGNYSAEMSFFDHIEELRWHLVRSLIAVFGAAIVVFIKINYFYDNIIMAPTKGDFITYRIFCRFGHFIGFGDKLCMGDVPLTFQNMQLAGQFIQAMSSAFIIGVIIASPYILWEFWRFIKPALKENELQYTRGTVFWTSLLFLMGVSFGYFVIIPYTVNFFAAYTISDSIHNLITINSYLSITRQVVLGTGLIFELPILTYFLAKIGIVYASTLRRYRKMALLLAIVLGAIITPPDIASQIIVAVPLYGLFEISILIAERVEKKQDEKDQKEWS